jgi:hypothetical protein
MRKLFAGVLLGSALGMLATAIARADDAPEASHKLFVGGNQVIAIGATLTPRVQSEFRPGSGSGITSIEAWQTGETTLLGRFHVLSFTDYRSYQYDHFVTDPVTVIGGAGQARVSSFRIHGDELESGGGIRLAPRVFAGIALLKRQETNGYPPLKGVGYALMLAPAPSKIISPYGWFTYQPNMSGIYALPDGTHTALSYRGTRYRFGVLLAEPGTRLALDIGYTGENLFNRSNAPARVNVSSLTAGLATHF